MLLTFFILLNGPFIFLSWHIIKREHAKNINLFSLIGGLWGIISMLPYLMMVGGYNSPPIYLAILTFPAWIVSQLIEFSAPFFRESHFWIWYHDSFIASTITFPFFIGMTLAYSQVFWLVNENSVLTVCTSPLQMINKKGLHDLFLLICGQEESRRK